MDSRNNNIVNELDFADAANRIEHRATPSLGVLLAQCGGQLNLNEVQEIAKLSIISEVINDAGVAELADAQDLGSGATTFYHQIILRDTGVPKEPVSVDR